MRFDGLDARTRRDEDRGGHGWLRFLTGWRPEPDARRVETPPAWKPKPDRVGICCSGGGIRSAAYSLGALQRLQQDEVLQKAEYLSAVSGGSYVAAAMTLARRSADDPFAPSSPEEQYLRNRTTYLVPHGGEGVFLGYRIVLGIAINLAFFGLAIGLPALLLGLLFEGLWGEGGGGVDAPDWPLTVAGALAALSFLSALYYVLRRFAKRSGDSPPWSDPSDDEPIDGPPTGPERHRLVVQTWTVRLLLAAVAFAFLFVLLPDLAGWIADPSDDAKQPDGTGAIAIPAAVATFVAGLLGQLLAREPKQLGADAGRVAKAGRAIWPRVLRGLAGVAATVAVPLLAVAWAAAVAGWAVAQDGAGGTWLAFGLGASALALLYTGGDLTSWSLHPFYRSRLASVFAQRRRRDDSGEQAGALDTYTEIPPMASAQPPEGPWPKLVICAAANISDPGATPHGRRVSSFTFSAEAIGGPLVGCVPTREYERGIAHVRSDVMTAVAVSGAALSPSMGKMTYRAGRALLALANVRLGVWMPNPRNTPDSAATVTATETPTVPKRPRPIFLLREILGKNDLRAPYLYVSDGGHYENLGLVELLRRGCTRIYCFDGGGGRGVGAALGDAIALARSELQVDIVVDPAAMAALEPDENGISAADHVVADIHYPDDDGHPSPEPTGKLVYARQLLTAAAPQDVHAHAKRNPKFPHDPTSDQFLTDQSFESYRALGRLAATNALAEPLDG
jgi:hypothetical protein